MTCVVCHRLPHTATCERFERIREAATQGDLTAQIHVFTDNVHRLVQQACGPLEESLRDTKSAKTYTFDRLGPKDTSPR